MELITCPRKQSTSSEWNNSSFQDDEYVRKRHVSTFLMFFNVQAFPFTHDCSRILRAPAARRLYYFQYRPEIPQSPFLQATLYEEASHSQATVQSAKQDPKVKHCKTIKLIRKSSFCLSSSQVRLRHAREWHVGNSGVRYNRNKRVHPDFLKATSTGVFIRLPRGQTRGYKTNICVEGFLHISSPEKVKWSSHSFIYWPRMQLKRC